MEDFLCSYQGLSVLGITLDIIGVLLVFLYVIPNTNASYAMDEKLINRIPFIKRMAYIGILLIIVGFILQIISSVMSYFSSVS